jgi:dienelactone hydrolase
MRSSLSRSLFAAMLAASWAPGLTSAAQSAALQPISVEALAHLPALQSVSMSPNGKHLVALIPSPKNPDETALATWDTSALAKGPTVVTPSGEHMKFIAASALKAGKILAIARQEWTGQLGGCGEGKITGATRTFITKAYITGDDQKSFEEAFAQNTRMTGVSKQTQECLELAGTASLIDMLPLDPDKVIIRQLSGVSLTSNYYLYSLKTGKSELLLHDNMRASPSLFDSRTGKVLARAEIEPKNDDYERKVLFLNPGTGQFELQPALTTKLSDRYTVDPVGIDDATGKYYVLTDQFSDRVQVRLYDAVKRQYDPEPVVADANYSIARLLFSTRPTNFNQVTGFVIDGPQPETVYVDPALKSIQASVKQAFPGQQVSLVDYTDDFSKVLFVTQSANVPPGYHLLLDKKQVMNLGSARSGIAADQTGVESWVSYKARDGREIPAILDLPAGWKQGDAATRAVVLPHGGPWARDYMGWDVSGWVPLLTSRGYAVLRPQYRGSKGLGRNLWLAGDAQWGLKMSDDLDEGAAWLVSQGIATKNRIAIFGYSYGGFAAVAAAVRGPSPYQCAIAGAPVANLGRLGTSWSDNRLQRILQGRTVKGMDPTQNTAKAHLPIMLFVGDRDVRTPSWHARDFYEAVKSTVPAQFHLIPDMPHSMPWYPRQQRETLNLIVNYLDKDCGSLGS